MRMGTAAAVVMAGIVQAQAGTPLPFDLGGSYSLTDQYGAPRTQADPDGHAQLLFFGYANCMNICSAARPDMADVVDLLAQDGLSVTPVMITVAPDQDRVDTMGAPLALIHEDFIGLTGDKAALAEACQAFSVEVTPIFEDPEYGWIYAHGSFIYLLDGQGKVSTLLPPVLGAEEIARIVRGYLSPCGKLTRATFAQNECAKRNGRPCWTARSRYPRGFKRLARAWTRTGPPLPRLRIWPCRSVPE